MNLKYFMRINIFKLYLLIYYLPKIIFYKYIYINIIKIVNVNVILFLKLNIIFDCIFKFLCDINKI